MPAPNNPIVRFKPCKRCSKEMQDSWTQGRLYCDDCSQIVRRERKDRKQKKQSREKLKVWEAKGPGICETCQSEFKRDRNDTRRFCGSCRLERRRAADRQKQRAERKTSEYKARYRDYMLRKSYGISAAQMNAIFVMQGSSCAICKSTDAQWKRKGWHVDHNHDTGVVRGILCQKCNLMIGLAMDSPSTLVSAAQYLFRSTIPAAAKAS